MPETEMTSAEQIRSNSVIETPIGKTSLRGLWEVLLSKKVHLQNFSVLIVVNFIVAGLGFARGHLMGTVFIGSSSQKNYG